MSTWIKRSTSKKYRLYHEHESMDQILVALPDAQQPEHVKEVLVARICEQGCQPSHSANTVRGVLHVSCDWIQHGTTTFQVSSGFKLLNTWGSHHLGSFQSFFTPAFVARLLQPGSGTDGNVPLLIREGLRVLDHLEPRVYYEHAQMVQGGITKFVCSTSDHLAVRNVGLLLNEFNQCIPSSENDATNFNLAIIHHLSAGQLNGDGSDILRSIKLVDEITDFLSSLWKNRSPAVLGSCLEEIFSIISSSRSDTNDENSQPAICLASVVKHIPVELATKVVKDVVTDISISPESIEAAISQIVEWLRWPSARNVDVWLSCFLTELAAARRYTTLVHIIEDNIEKVVEEIAYPHLRTPSFKILSQMLLGFQHSPGPFHKMLDKIPPIIMSLRHEGTSQSQVWLNRVAQLIHCLMYKHAGFPEVYDPILDLIKDLPRPTIEEIKAQLKQTEWCAQVSGSVAMETMASSPVITSFKQEKLETGKTGLENLINTCYMNSVIQALFMCDQFRRGALAKCPSGKESLLVKLQHVFAMLGHSSRPTFAPTKFLQASRPPWFLPGHQQDCSEFLKYLLDQLHEDEKSGGGHKRNPSSESVSISPNGTIKLNRSLSKTDKKEPVMLTGVKMKTEEEMNGFTSHAESCNSDNGESSASSCSTLVEQTFRGKVQTTLKCLACKHESRRTESFSDIPLAFPNSSKSTDYPNKILAGGSGASASSSSVETTSNQATENDKEMPNPSEECLTLNDLISFYLKPEKLTGDNKYHCDHCGKLQDGERSIQIMESPQYLILTLLRFSYDTKLQTRTKIFQDVCYPRTLAVPVNDASSPKDTKSTASKRHSRNSSTPKTATAAAKLESIAKRLAPKCENTGKSSQHCDLYGLSAVIVHSGTSSECGHYYCYARHSQAGQVDPAVFDRVNGNLEKLDLLQDKWYNFNDSRVSHAAFDSFSNVTKRFSKDTAYVLIYRKLEVGEPNSTLNPEPPLRADLRDAVVQDNEKFIQEQEIEARAREEQRRRSASTNSVNLHNWRGDDDDNNQGGGGGGSLGCGGGFGGGMDTSGSRFVY